MYIIVGFLVGVVLTLLAMRLWQKKGTESKQVELQHGNLPLLVDLMRRAHGGAAACLVVSDGDPVWAMARPAPSSEVLDRALASARLAMGDGRDHVLHEGQTVVAAGDGRTIGGAVVFYSPEVQTDTSSSVATDLRTVFADVGAQMARTSGGYDAQQHLPEWLVGGPESLEGLSFQLCEAAMEVSGRPSALVIRDATTQVASVVAVSAGTDRRLLGAQISPSAALGRACLSDVPIAGSDSEELFGSLRADRRRQGVGGLAFPLWDGRDCIGALAVLGEHSNMALDTRDQLQWLVRNAGPRLGRAAALRNAETRAMTDELTGLPNRRALERSMHGHVGISCSILCVDLDHFKALNDGFGHAAGDAALRHVAAIFRNELRSGDLPARIGGEEFALWLPDAPAGKAMEIAERVREAVRTAPFEHGGAEIRITCSIGVASIPDSVSQVENLLGAADVAMYRAKEGGRDRVEMALPKPT